jgi:TseV toxin immunity protein TsiV
MFQSRERKMLELSNETVSELIADAESVSQERSDLSDLLESALKIDHTSKKDRQRIHGVITGKLTGFDETGSPMVTFHEIAGQGAACARSINQKKAMRRMSKAEREKLIILSPRNCKRLLSGKKMMNMDRFKYIESDICVVTACLELVAFSGASIKEGGKGFTNFYREFQKRFGDSLRLYSTDTMKRTKRVDARALEMLPFWFSDEQAESEVDIGIRLHSGKTSQDSIPPAFEMLCDQVSEPSYSYFRMVLPPDWVDGSTEPFLDLARNSLAEFPLLSGYAGYSFFWDALDPDMNEEATSRIGPWLKRYPGFSHGDAAELPELALEGIVGINWLTLLGSEYVDRLGCERNISQSLGPEIKLHSLGHGMIIQAGERPEIGDLNRKQTLPLYHKVGKFLNPIKASGEEAWVEGLDPDEMEEWFDRFFA